MRLRWKFFLVLLGFSLVPMVVITAFNRDHVVKLGRAIADEGQVLLKDIVQNELRQTAEDYALILRRTKSAMDFSLSVLASEAGQALAGHAPAAATPPGANPPDTGAAAAPRLLIRHPPETRADAGQDARLAALAPTFAMLQAELGDLLVFASVALPDGVHATFPARGDFPADYDPRLRPWYLAAKAAFVPGQSGASPVLWNDPAVDAVTGQVTLTLSKALTGPDGGFAGVASLDVPLARVLQEQEIASQWSEAMRTFVVVPAKDPKTGGSNLYVWAQRSFTDQAPDWKSAVSFDRLTTTDAAGFAALLDAMRNKRSGVAELPYNGQNAFWAFARLLNEVSFLVILPTSMLSPLTEQAGQEILAATNKIVRLSGIAMAVVLVAVTLAALRSTRAFVRPLVAMIEAWKRLGSGDFSVRLNLKMGDERQSLVDAFNETVPILADHVQLQQSMELAQEVQRNLLPAAPPVIPGLDVAGAGLSCDATGGDYYDYRSVVRDGEVCLDTAVGDVTGHGVPSALLMATARALLLATEDNETPGQRVRRANRLLCRDVGDSGRFMTLMAMEVRPLTGQACYVRAGHDPAMLYDPENDDFTEWPGRGVPLGIDPDYPYAENVMPFDRPGLVLAIGTDGIWEARGPSGEMYGKDRFKAALQGAASGPAAAVVAAVLADLAAFRGDRRQEDDVTLVVVKKT
jgi:sigma-B regulation protein RsbU (phosphoserine phosphatase)